MDVGSCTQGESTLRIDLVVIPASPPRDPASPGAGGATTADGGH